MAGPGLEDGRRGCGGGGRREGSGGFHGGSGQVTPGRGPEEEARTVGQGPLREDPYCSWSHTRTFLGSQARKPKGGLQGAGEMTPFPSSTGTRAPK